LKASCCRLRWKIRKERRFESSQSGMRCTASSFEVEALDERTRAIREMTASTAGPAGPAPVKAPMPGLVLRINVKVGDEIAAGHAVAVMEAMKMENELRSVGPGRVKAILVEPGTAVEKGAVLVELE
jgi:biotin carboxyl carrier protein